MDLRTFDFINGQVVNTTKPTSLPQFIQGYKVWEQRVLDGEDYLGQMAAQMMGMELDEFQKENSKRGFAYDMRQNVKAYLLKKTFPEGEPYEVNEIPGFEEAFTKRFPEFA